MLPFLLLISASHLLWQLSPGKTLSNFFVSHSCSLTVVPLWFDCQTHTHTQLTRWMEKLIQKKKVMLFLSVCLSVWEKWTLCIMSFWCFFLLLVLLQLLRSVSGVFWSAFFPHKHSDSKETKSKDVDHSIFLHLSTNCLMYSNANWHYHHRPICFWSNISTFQQSFYRNFSFFYSSFLFFCVCTLFRILSRNCREKFIFFWPIVQQRQTTVVMSRCILKRINMNFCELNLCFYNTL